MSVSNRGTNKSMSTAQLFGHVQEDQKRYDGDGRKGDTRRLGNLNAAV